MGDPSVAVVILTQGTRPDDLRAAIDSVLSQRDVTLDVLVVGNGWEPEGLPDGVRGLGLPENVGIPAGRNAGVPHVDGTYLLFVDDDARLASDDYVSSAIEMFRRHPERGLIHPRVDASEGDAPTRWIPRIRKGDPRRSSTAHALWEGATVMRRDVWDVAGPWPENFWYAHEGIELVWQVWDAGFVPWYAGDIVALHPPINPTRHGDYHHLNARNRVFLARRNLPLALRPLYVGTWTLVQLLRAARGGRGEVASLRPWFAGWWEGWRADPGPRRPMSWRTVARLTRHGRPPII